MTTIVWSVSIGGILLLLGFSALLRRLTSAARASEEDMGVWLDSFSITRYRPMERLLSEADYEFLAAQPGYDPSIARQLRAERRKVFRVYLNQLSKDFSRLHQVARLLVLYSPEDRPDLARTLMRQKLVFHVAVLNVRWHLLLNAAGMSNVDVKGLLGAVDQLNLQVRQPVFHSSAA